MKKHHVCKAKAKMGLNVQLMQASGTIMQARGLKANAKGMAPLALMLLNLGYKGS